MPVWNSSRTATSRPNQMPAPVRHVSGAPANARAARAAARSRLLVPVRRLRAVRPLALEQVLQRGGGIVEAGEAVRATSSASQPARASTRCSRPRIRIRSPSAEARMITDRPSALFFSLATRPSASIAVTRRVIDGGETPSASASLPSVRGPPKTSTDSADRRAPLSPRRVSSRWSRRSRWIATELSRVARAGPKLGPAYLAAPRGWSPAGATAAVASGAARQIPPCWTTGRAVPWLGLPAPLPLPPDFGTARLPRTFVTAPRLAPSAFVLRSFAFLPMAVS